jgi:pyruvate dehydrogenase E2 component (dihydrolipoamide acetyltransferase)
MATTIDVKVPDIGDFKDVEVIEVLVKPGDVIAKDQSLITVESDKASMEIPSTHAGTVKELRVQLGHKVSQGTVLLVAEAADAASAAPSPASTAAPAPAATPASAPVAVQPPSVAASVPAAAGRTVPTAALAPVPTDPSPANRPHASPSVRKFARELGVPLERVQGTAPKGRITQEDIQNFVKGVVSGSIGSSLAIGSQKQHGTNGSIEGVLTLLPWPRVDFAKFGPVRSEPLSRIKKISGPNLARNWAMIPHVTQFDEADITELEQFRKDTNAALEKQGVKVTMLAFVMKACVSVLKKMPAFNSSLDETGENLILKDYWHIGFAADTPNGLMVPVLKDVDRKGFAQIASETAELAKTARDGKLKPTDMQGATFTISSLGGVGGTAFTPIVNAPEVAILGLSKSDFKPKWDGQQFVPRLMLPLSLSYDHRVIDGAMAARFTTELAGLLADMRKALL